MTLQKQILFVLVLLSVSSLAQDVQNPLGVEILCSLDWPTRPETCLQVYAPVCASYPRACLVPPCPQVQDFPSNCIACQDPNVESYRPGACAFVCEANAALITDQPFSPVCAIYQEGCNNPTCRKSFRNSNAACQDSNVISFTNGVCEGDVLEENEQEIVPEEEVIIIIPPEEEQEQEQEQEQEGETETETGAEVIYAPIKGVEILCSVNWPTRPEFCPELYAPVCASYPRACLVPPCPQVQQFPSNCFACQNPNVQSYRPGACEVVVIPPEEEEEAVEGIIIEEELIWDEETILVEDEEEEQSSNDFYVGIPCDDPRPEICSEQNDPVCIIECADNVCRKTASSACNACLDPNVLIYTPQSCEVERIQCAAQDLSATNFACTDLYDPVCAYSRDCEGDACSGTTASNDCYACTIQGADYYIRGGCPGSSAT